MAIWPTVMWAQQRGQVARIGVLMSTAANDPEGEARITEFRQALQRLGWTEVKAFKLTSAGQEAMPRLIVNSRLNWLRSRLM
jgi:hypothetical protein